MANITIKINGMGCEHCVKSITEALTELNGINKVNVSLEKACAEVEYDESKIGTDKMLEAIKELEFEPSI